VVAFELRKAARKRFAVGIEQRRRPRARGRVDALAQWDAAGCTGGIACPAIACVNPGTHAVCTPINSGDFCMGAN